MKCNLIKAIWNHNLSIFIPKVLQIRSLKGTFGDTWAAVPHRAWAYRYEIEVVIMALSDTEKHLDFILLSHFPRHRGLFLSCHSSTCRHPSVPFICLPVNIPWGHSSVNLTINLHYLSGVSVTRLQYLLHLSWLSCSVGAGSASGPSPGIGNCNRLTLKHNHLIGGA